MQFVRLNDVFNVIYTWDVNILLKCFDKIQVKGGHGF
jgi:hypothetical protein